METTYYTFTAREILVEGEDVRQVSGSNARQLVCVRRARRCEERPAEEKIVDFAAWKADKEEKERLEQLWYADVEDAGEDWQEEPVQEYIPRERKVRRPALNWELWSGAAVIGTMAMLFVRILMM